jgi:hypothetical protein
MGATRLNLPLEEKFPGAVKHSRVLFLLRVGDDFVEATSAFAVFVAEEKMLCASALGEFRGPRFVSPAHRAKKPCSSAVPS